MKRFLPLVLSLILILASITGCATKTDTVVTETVTKNTTITLAAAASLKNCFEDSLIPLFYEKHPEITVQTTYDSSGKLQTQIEEGADVDVFFSAGMKQMNALVDSGLVSRDTVSELLDNEVVLIKSAGINARVDSFENIGNAETIAIGDPESVPAGQYAKEVLTSLGFFDGLTDKFSLGTNVTEVLNWVAEGSANVGIVYATDAASTDKVEIIASAPNGSVGRIIYPVGMVTKTAHEKAAKDFLAFLASEEAAAIFKDYGFIVNGSK